MNDAHYMLELLKHLCLFLTEIDAVLLRFMIFQKDTV